ncbi:hypothetical protein [Kribbella sp. NPDC003557]|uniref:hypothetical protein n=1 Tax=Kribbella sp. NPDC003557 TaxID=3154449 RepID=UPI0033AA4B9D
MGGAAHALVALITILVLAVVFGVTEHGNVGIGGRIAAFAIVLLILFTIILVANAIS